MGVRRDGWVVSCSFALMVSVVGLSGLQAHEAGEQTKAQQETAPDAAAATSAVDARGTWPRVHIPDPAAASALRSALDRAWTLLAEPQCRRVLRDFSDRGGHSLELEWLDPAGSDVTRLSREKLRAYTELLKQQATELEAEIQLVRLHPRYSPLVVDGSFGLPVVNDGPGEVERLDTIIEQIRSALERLASNEALQEVRGAIREYRDSEKRQTLARRRRR